MFFGGTTMIWLSDGYFVDRGMVERDGVGSGAQRSHNAKNYVQNPSAEAPTHKAFFPELPVFLTRRDNSTPSTIPPHLHRVTR